MAKDFVCAICKKIKRLSSRTDEFFVLQPGDRANLETSKLPPDKEPGRVSVCCHPKLGFNIDKQACWPCVKKIQNERWHLSYLSIRELRLCIEASAESGFWNSSTLEQKRKELAERQKALDGMPFFVKTLYSYKIDLSNPYYKITVYSEKVKPKYYILADYSPVY